MRHWVIISLNRFHGWRKRVPSPANVVTSIDQEDEYLIMQATYRLCYVLKFMFLVLL